jgi:hypothetical protein
MEAAPRLPTTTSNLDKQPNFDALKRWMGQLESWSVDIYEERQRLLAEKEEITQERDGLQQVVNDVEWKADAYDTLVEKLADAARGIADFQEVYDLCGVRA